MNNLLETILPEELVRMVGSYIYKTKEMKDYDRVVNSINRFGDRLNVFYREYEDIWHMVSTTNYLDEDYDFGITWRDKYNNVIWVICDGDEEYKTPSRVRHIDKEVRVSEYKEHVLGIDSDADFEFPKYRNIDSDIDSDSDEDMPRTPPRD